MGLVRTSTGIWPVSNQDPTGIHQRFSRVGSALPLPFMLTSALQFDDVIAFIRPTYGAIITNLLTVDRFNAGGLTSPGCWAYPDM